MLFYDAGIYKNNCAIFECINHLEMPVCNNQTAVKSSVPLLYSQRKVENFRKNHAAKTIQNRWTDYKYRRHEEDLDEV